MSTMTSSLSCFAMRFLTELDADLVIDFLGSDDEAAPLAQKMRMLLKEVRRRLRPTADVSAAVEVNFADLEEQRSLRERPVA